MRPMAFLDFKMLIISRLLVPCLSGSKGVHVFDAVEFTLSASKKVGVHKLYTNDVRKFPRML